MFVGPCSPHARCGLQPQRRHAGFRGCCEQNGRLRKGLFSEYKGFARILELSKSDVQNSQCVGLACRIHTGTLVVCQIRDHFKIKGVTQQRLEQHGRLQNGAKCNNELQNCSILSDAGMHAASSAARNRPDLRRRADPCGSRLDSGFAASRLVQARDTYCPERAKLSWLLWQTVR